MTSTNAGSTNALESHRIQRDGAPAPIYITVGPQCCGKTTFLKNKLEDSSNPVVDISLDDQPGVYYSVPTDNWLKLIGEKSKTLQVNPEILKKTFHGKTLEERIKQDNEELNLILLRWDQQLSPQTFATRILHLYSSNSHSSTNDIHQEKKSEASKKVAHTLIQAVEEFLSTAGTKSHLPENTDIFCVESLFRPNPETNLSAIEQAHDLMRKSDSRIPIAWGNTNSKPKDYQQVLEFAYQTKRPVYFVLCHPASLTDSKESNNGINNNKTNTSSSSHLIPWINFENLFKRNLHRLASKGRYIPAMAINDCCQRVEQLLPPQHNFTSLFQAEKILVEIASSHHHHSRNHHQNYGGRHPASYHYLLTNQRLIQKEYQNKHPQQQEQQQQRIRPFGPRPDRRYENLNRRPPWSNNKGGRHHNDVQERQRRPQQEVFRRRPWERQPNNNNHHQPKRQRWNNSNGNRNGN